MRGAPQMQQFSRGPPPPLRGLPPRPIQPPPPAVGGTLSPDFPSPSWPLRSDKGSRTKTPGSTAKSLSQQVPNRPQRPAEPPAFLDVRNNLSPQYAEDDFLSPMSYTSPNPNRQTSSSVGSNTSSLGSIPDFPVPTAVIPAPRRFQPLGPPPSARRGPSSYYSHMSNYVSPIVEESSELRGSKGSFASSNVIPSGVPEFYLEDGEGETNSDDDMIDYYDGQDHGPKPLVRQASLGKRAKPTLTVVSSPLLSQDSPALGSTPKAKHSVSAFLDAVTPPSATEEFVERDTLPKKGNTLHKKSASSVSRNSLARAQSPASPEVKSPVSMWSAFGRRTSRSSMRSPPPQEGSVDQILAGLEKGGAIDAAAAGDLRQVPKSGLGDRVGPKKPPRLNVDAVREAEARGSMTSLPDLIRRATRLASNLDRGRTASRLGMDFFFDNTGRERAEGLKDNDSDNERKSIGSLAEMIRAFPSPSRATPDRDHTPTPYGTAWPSAPSSQRQLHSRRGKNRKNRSGRRECCGMSLRVFIILLIVLVLLVAAAVVVPVLLIGLPKMHAAKNHSPANELAQCKSQNPCENGGTVTVLTGGTCSCVCANGFTGPRCLNAADAGCAMTAMPGTANATVGSEIATLLSEANSVFGVPLDGQTILSLFARGNFSCAAENALVTLVGLPGNSKRSVAVEQKPRPEAIIVTRVTEELRRRKPHWPADLMTSDGLLLDSTITFTPPATNSAAAPTTTGLGGLLTAPGNPTATAAPAPVVNDTPGEFAKVAILFVLQESLNFSAAIQAEQQINGALQVANAQSGGSMPQNINLGNGFAVNLQSFTIALANGTTFGHANGAPNATVSGSGSGSKAHGKRVRNRFAA